MRISVVAVGRVKHAALRAACDEYADRIRRYVTFEVREVSEVAGRNRTADTVRRAEASRLLNTLPRGTRVFALSREGRAESSPAFARRLGAWREDARDVALVIGGAHGLDASVFDRAEDRLSLSSFTLSHELARTVLLEQVYRACTILKGEPYHKSAQ